MRVVLGFLVFTFVAPVFGNDAVSPEIQHALDSTVLIESRSAMGTGVVVNIGNETFVWTAAHVLESSQVYNSNYNLKTNQYEMQVNYLDVLVRKDIVINGRKVGEENRLAKIIRYNRENDIALLKLFDGNWIKKSVTFNYSVPKIGQKVFHIGNFYGEIGVSSYSEGTVSSVGRTRRNGSLNLMDPIIYDQLSIVAHVGSSGGGVFNGDGECIGLIAEFLVREAPGSLCFVPTRRIVEYAREHHCLWAITDVEFNEKEANLIIVDQHLSAEHASAIIQRSNQQNQPLLVPPPEPTPPSQKSPPKEQDLPVPAPIPKIIIDKKQKNQ